MAGPIDLGTVSYLTFEGGGGKGLVYLGAVAALENVLNPDLPKRYADVSGVPVEVPEEWLSLTNRPLFDINTHPTKRPFAGVSGASAGAITALFVAMGMSSLEIDEEINAIITGGLRLGNPADKVPASRFEQFFDDPLPYVNLAVAPQPAQKTYKNTFVGDDLLARLTAEATLIGAVNELADEPALVQLSLIRRLLLTRTSQDPIDTDLKLYLQSLIGNRGLFTLRKVRNYFGDVIKRRLINRFGNWSTTFPEIPANPGSLTFRQFLKVTGVDLVVMGSNTSQGSSLPFSAGATPDFPVAEAVMLSMSIPVLFKPLYIDTVVHSDPKDLRVRDINEFYKGLWVDGGMLNNYPRHVFKYVKTVDGLTYRDDQRMVPVAVPWRLFDVRMVDLRPPDVQVLGFTLSSFGPSEVTDPFAKRDTLVSLKYSGRLLEAMLKASTENQIRSPEDELMTIGLDPGGMSVLDFAGPDLDEQRGYMNTAAAKRKSIQEAFSRTRKRVRYTK